MRALLLWLALALPAGAQDRPVVLIQSTTSTEASGLYDAILPQAEAALGLDIRVVAVGTGQALRNAAACDGDLVIVHAPEAEEAFVAAGHGLERHPLMENDFVVVGPAADPAGVAGLRDAGRALAAIAAARAPFASRGDDSGTHRAERALWPDPRLADAGSGEWYLETGAGMGATLNLAVARGAYALTDRATWLAFGNRGDHRVLVEGDPRLANPYGVIAVDPARCPNVEAAGAAALVDWLLSEDGQAAIGAYEVEGVQLFRPTAE